MSGSLRAVLFDVDGTLVDTNYLHAVTWWQAFAQGGHYVPMADIHLAIGMGPDQMLDQVLPSDRDSDAEDATFSGEVEATKPAPDLVQVALEKAAVRAEQAVFIGDTVWDVQASQKAGVPCIGLLSGGIGRQELVDAGAAQIYADPAELLAELPHSLLGRGDGGVS